MIGVRFHTSHSPKIYFYQCAAIFSACHSWVLFHPSKAKQSGMGGGEREHQLHQSFSAALEGRRFSASFCCLLPPPPLPPLASSCVLSPCSTCRLRLLSFLGPSHCPKGRPGVCANVVRDELVEPPFLALQTSKLRRVGLWMDTHMQKWRMVELDPQRIKISGGMSARLKPTIRSHSEDKRKEHVRSRVEIKKKIEGKRCKRAFKAGILMCLIPSGNQNMAHLIVEKVVGVDQLQRHFAQLPVVQQHLLLPRYLDHSMPLVAERRQ